MATIPMGNFGQAIARPAPRPSIPQGDPVGRAVERTGAIAAQAVDDRGMELRREREQQDAEAQRAQREAQAEEQRQQREAHLAAVKAATITALTGTKDKLADLHDEINQGVLDGTLPKDKAESEYAARSAKVLEGVGSDLPETQRGVVLAELQGDAARLGNGVRKAVTQRNRQDVTASIVQTLEHLQRQYRADPAKATQQAMSLVDQLGPQSTLNPEQLAKLKQSWKESTQYTAGFELVSAGKNDRRLLDAAEQAINKGLPDLDPQRKAALTDRIAGYRMHLDQKAELAAARAQRAAESRLRDAEAAWKIGNDLARDGILAVDEGDRLLTQMRGTSFAPAFKRMLEVQRQTGPVAAMPLAQVRGRIDQLNAAMARGGVDQATKAARDQLQDVAAAQERDIARDGALRAAAQRGVIVAPEPLNFAAGLPAVGQQLRGRVVQADVVRGWTGKAESPLMPEEAEQLATVLASSDPQGFGQAVSMLGTMVPPEQMAAIARQIDPKDKPLALALAVGAQQTTEGRTVAELIRHGAQAVKDKAPETKGNEAAQLREDIIKAVGDSVPARLRDDIIEAATLIAHGSKAGGGRSTPLGAVHLALGGPIIGHNGKRLPVPAGVDQYVLRDRLEAYPRADVDRQAADGWVQFAGGRPMGVPEFLAALPGAELEPAGKGKYTVRVGGSMALNKDRRPLVIEVQR